MIKLSICIPTYNRLNTLLNIIESLKELTFDSHEIIVCDDSTNDLTEKYFKKNNSIKINYFKNERKLGQFKNCNACIARARGEWVHIIHDDDTINPAYLCGLQKALENKDAVIIAGKTIFEGYNFQEIQSEHDERLGEMGLIDPVQRKGRLLIPAILRLGNPLVFSHTIFKKEVAISHGGFDNNLEYIGDFDLWLKILQSGDLVIVNNIFGKYRLHDNNYSNSQIASWDLCAEILLQKIKYLNFLKSYYSQNEYKMYIKEIRKEISKACYFSDTCSKRASLSAELREVLYRHYLKPSLDIRSIIYLLLNSLPKKISLKFYDFIKKKAIY